LHRAGGRRPAAIFAAGKCDLEDIAAARVQVEDAIAEMLDYAARAICRSRSSRCIRPMPPTALASIPRNRRSIFAIVSIRTAVVALGVALDVYHIWWDPELLPQISRAAKDRLLAFTSATGWLPTKDILNDRGMMGDGVIDIKTLRGAAEAQGFGGYSEIEIFSTTGGQSRWTSVADLHTPASLGSVTKANTDANLRTGTAPARQVASRGLVQESGKSSSVQLRKGKKMINEVLVVGDLKIRDGASRMNTTGWTKRMYGIVSNLPGFLSVKSFKADDGEVISIIRLPPKRRWKPGAPIQSMWKRMKRGHAEFYGRGFLQIWQSDPGSWPFHHP